MCVCVDVCVCVCSRVSDVSQGDDVNVYVVVAAFDVGDDDDDDAAADDDDDEISPC